VLRGIQCIDMWASELRSELPQNLCPGQYLVLYRLGELVELGFKQIVEFDLPWHD